MRNSTLFNVNVDRLEGLSIEEEESSISSDASQDTPPAGVSVGSRHETMGIAARTASVCAALEAKPVLQSSPEITRSKSKESKFCPYATYNK
jgi:hypothetical protein